MFGTNQFQKQYRKKQVKRLAALKKSRARTNNTTLIKNRTAQITMLKRVLNK